jgi:hypothetical protein
MNMEVKGFVALAAKPLSRTTAVEFELTLIHRPIIFRWKQPSTPGNNMNTKLFNTIIAVLAVFQAPLIGLEIGIGLWLWVIIGVATLAFLCTLYFAMLLNRA